VNSKIVYIKSKP